MNESIINSGRDIDLRIKIRTECKEDTIKYLRDHIEIITTEIQNNTPINIVIQISESETEKHTSEAEEIIYSDLEIHKWIFIKLSYKYEFDVNKSYNGLMIHYLREVIDKYIAKMIIGRKSEELGGIINIVPETADESLRQCLHEWLCLGRAHNKGDGKGKYKVYKCTKCNASQTRYLGKRNKELE